MKYVKIAGGVAFAALTVVMYSLLVAAGSESDAGRWS